MERLEPVVTNRRIRQRQQCQQCKIKVIEMWSVQGVPSGRRTRKRFLMPTFFAPTGAFLAFGHFELPFFAEIPG